MKTISLILWFLGGFFAIPTLIGIAASILFIILVKDTDTETEKGSDYYER